LQFFIEMTRKKRRFEQLEAAASEPKKKTEAYVDPFQRTVGRRLEDATRIFEGQGKNILYGLAAVVVLVILLGIFYAWNKRSDAAAQTALGKAIETSQAIVTASPLPAGSKVKSFKSEKERSDAAIAEFQAVADKFGGSVGEKAKYFAAVTRLNVDRPTAIQDLTNLANSKDDVGKMAKFALAQADADDGKTDEAIALYQELAGMSDPIVSKETINFELAKLYEKQGKKQEALDLYFNIAKTAAEAKDAEGKPITMTQTARDAKDKVQELDPAKAKEIPEPEPQSPFGGQ
jgi:tetratricopeptide (TPR) repeat protein